MRKRLTTQMKIRFILAALYSVFMLSVATAAEGPAKVRLLYSDESHEDVYLYSYKAGTATYKTNLKSLNILQVKKPRLEAVYFYEPELFIQAMDLYRDKNYAEAKTKIAECEETPGRRCKVGAFHGGLRFRLYSQLEIRDVRLVYAPPSSIGKSAAMSTTGCGPATPATSPSTVRGWARTGSPQIHLPTMFPSVPSTG